MGTGNLWKTFGEVLDQDNEYATIARVKGSPMHEVPANVGS